MLANEGLRRMLNISPDLPWEEFVMVMNTGEDDCDGNGYGG